MTTTVGYQGLDVPAELGPPADDAEQFAARTRLLLRDDAAWRRARELGIDYVRRHFSRASMRESLTLTPPLARRAGIESAPAAQDIADCARTMPA